MSATWILVLLLFGAVLARAMRSTKMWWVFLFTILAGLLVGMLGKEAVNHFTKNDTTASIIQLINTVDNTGLHITSSFSDRNYMPVRSNELHFISIRSIIRRIS